ncbi:MAG: ComEC/Rec2 family competence protein [Bacteroidales bacterium]|nr:ComEC/Rec2 family competence protein [Bacteroidales bacterium]
MNSHIEFKQIPFVRILIPYILGILAASIFYPDFFYLLLIGIVFIVTILFIGFFTLNREYQRIGKVTILYGGFFLCGLFSFSLANSMHKFPDHTIFIDGIVKNSPEVTSRYMQVDCRIQNYSFQDKKVSVNENIRVFIFRDPAMKIPEIGDSVCLISKLYRLKNRGNPKEFDYKNYMRNEKIFYVCYVSVNKIRFGANTGKYKLRRFASSIQKRSIKRFTDYGIKDEELAVISALVAGNREFLDEEIKNKFAIAGVMHVLAVSGLHVGILYMFLSLILCRRNQTLFIRVLRLILILFTIWFFALITGLSCSVVRASLMFTLFLLGRNLNRQTNVYNLLAASAMIALVIHPMDLFKVGFQFSYLAVLGIVFLQPRLFEMINFTYKIPDRIWQLITVSIAAQVSVFPLSLYYFHQFPVYFWLANIFVIPLVWMIMITAMIFFLFLAIDPMAETISLGLDKLLKILNAFIECIEKLPLAVIPDIRFESIHLIMTYVFIVAILIAIVKYRKVYVAYIAGIWFAWIILQDIVTYKYFDQKKEILVYNYGKNTVLSCINGHNHVLFLNEIEHEYTEKIMHWNRNFQVSRQVLKTTENIDPDNVPLYSGLTGEHLEISHTNSGINIRFFKKRITLIKDNGKGVTDRSIVINDSDWLVLGGNSVCPEQLEFASHLPQKIIIGNKISHNLCFAWNKFASEKGIEFIDVTVDGAFHEIWE